MEKSEIEGGKLLEAIEKLEEIFKVGNPRELAKAKSYRPLFACKQTPFRDSLSKSGGSSKHLEGCKKRAKRGVVCRTHVGFFLI